MSLKNSVVPFPQADEPSEGVSQEDAWLNDVVPRPQSPGPESATGGRPAEAPATLAGVEMEAGDTHAAALPVHFAPGHPLWPAVLSLSERIWHELRQLADLTSAPEAVLVRHVRERALAIMRADLTLARQVSEIAQAEALLQNVTDEVLGSGPLEYLLKDETVTKIMAVGPRFVYVERGKRVEDVACYFEDDRHMLRIVENMLRRAGRRLPTSWPIVDVRLPDGSLVNVVLPPSAVNGPTITILKGPGELLDISGMLASATMTQEMADFLAACVRGRLNIVVCGAAGSGRTTLLNALSTYIAADERIATLEEVAELRLHQKHVIAMAAQRNGSSGGGSVTLRDLVVYALRTGAERFLLDECRGDEVVELLHAMNNGRGGVLMTVFASDVRNCLTRLENMYRAADTTLPPPLMRAQLASALDVIVHVSRLRDGSHRVLNIAEVRQGENGTLKLQSIFHFRTDTYGRAAADPLNSFEPSGFAPSFLPRLRAMGLQLSPEMFRLRNVPGPARSSSSQALMNKT
jgi:pilus assembly protein CpaF